MFGLRLGFCCPDWLGTHCVAQADFKFMAVLFSSSRILGYRLEITHAWLLSFSFGGCFHDIVSLCPSDPFVSAA